MTNETLYSFIREVNLTTEVPYHLRAQALDILMERYVGGPYSIRVSYEDGERYVNLSDAIYAEVLNCLKNNHFIEAIKILRSELGLGLREAKATMDNFRDELRRKGILPPLDN